jgi:putative FmdB family regulatory protein
MPVYEYRCSKCKYEFERMHQYKTLVVQCPLCGAQVTKRVSKVSPFKFSEKDKSWNA